MTGSAVVVAGSGVLVVASGGGDVGAGVAHVGRGRVVGVGVFGIVAIGPLAVVRVRHVSNLVPLGLVIALLDLFFLFSRFTASQSSRKEKA